MHIRLDHNRQFFSLTSRNRRQHLFDGSARTAGSLAFLAAHHAAAGRVRSVKLENISKADAIRSERGDGETAVFADDDITELAAPEIAGDARVHRVLFLRG